MHYHLFIIDLNKSRMATSPEKKKQIICQIGPSTKKIASQMLAHTSGLFRELFPNKKRKVVINTWKAKFSNK